MTDTIKVRANSMWDVKMKPQTTELHIEQCWKNPVWETGGRVHNWHNHVPDGVRTIWGSFDDNQKFALYRWAEDLSDAEEWQ